MKRSDFSCFNWKIFLCFAILDILFFAMFLAGCGGGGGGGSDATNYVQFVSTGVLYEWKARVNSCIFPNYSSRQQVYMHGNPLTWWNSNGITLSEVPESDPILESSPFIATGQHIIRFSGGIIPETEKLAYLESGFFSIGANFLKSSVEPLFEGGFVQPPPVIIDPYQKVAMVNLVYFGRPCQLRGLVFYVTGDLVGGWTNDHLLPVKPTEDWKIVIPYTDSTVTKSWNIFWDVPGDFFIPEAGSERDVLESYLDLNALKAAGLGCYITQTSSSSNAYFQISAGSLGSLSPATEIDSSSTIIVEDDDCGGDCDDNNVSGDSEIDPNSEFEDAGEISGDALPDPNSEVVEEDPVDGDSGGIQPAMDSMDSNDGVSPDTIIEGEIGEVVGNSHFMWRIADGKYILFFKESDCGDYPDDGSPFYLLGEVVGTWECLEGNELIPSSEFPGYWESLQLNISGWKDFNFAWMDNSKHYAWYSLFSSGNPFVNFSRKSFRGNFTEGTVLPPE